MLLGAGLEAIGGEVAIPAALAKAVYHGHAGILQMKIHVTHIAEGMPESWISCTMAGRPLVCCAVVQRSLTVLSVLLAAGADVTARSTLGHCARDFLCNTEGPRAAFGRCWRGHRLFVLMHGLGP